MPEKWKDESWEDLPIFYNIVGGPADGEMVPLAPGCSTYSVLAEKPGDWTHYPPPPGAVPNSAESAIFRYRVGRVFHRERRLDITFLRPDDDHRSDAQVWIDHENSR